MKYHFRIYKEKKGGYSAQCVELKGCITQGDSMRDLYKNMEEALNLYVQEPEDSEDLAALPKRIRTSKTVVAVSVDPQIAFSFMIRYHRIKHHMTQQQVANELGFSDVYSYQRLEAKRCNPTLKILSRIKRMFPDFSIDYAIGY